jgi:hypothetical protein
MRCCAGGVDLVDQRFGGCGDRAQCEVGIEQACGARPRQPVVAAGICRKAGGDIGVVGQVQGARSVSGSGGRFEQRHELGAVSAVHLVAHRGDGIGGPRKRLVEREAMGAGLGCARSMSPLAAARERAAAPADRPDVLTWHEAAPLDCHLWVDSVRERRTHADDETAGELRAPQRLASCARRRGWRAARAADQTRAVPPPSAQGLAARPGRSSDRARRRTRCRADQRPRG